MVEYRRAIRTEVWHWNPQCQEWPSRTFEIRKAQPFAELLCERCRETPSEFDTRR